MIMIGELVQGIFKEAAEGASPAVKKELAGAYNMAFLGSVDPNP